MRKFLLIMALEYSRNVFRWRFLVSLMSLPALFFVALFVVYLVTPRSKPSRPIGIVDPSGSMTSILQDSRTSSGIDMIHLESEAKARLALDDGNIQAYLVIPIDYPFSGMVQLVAKDPLNSSDHNKLVKLLRIRMLQDHSPEVIARLMEGDHIIVQSSTGTSQSQDVGIWTIFLPILAVFVFMLAIFSTSGFLMQAVTVEKENRTMELIITSTTHVKLLSAKMIGILAIGFTQLLIWLGFIYFVISIGQDTPRLAEHINLPPRMIFVFISSLSLAFAMIAAIMIGVGAVVTQATEGQQITGPFSLPFLLPFVFLFQILNSPDGSLALWMSFIPFTSPITLITRLCISPVPTWQINLSLAIQASFVIFLIWLAARAFRAGMLQYGKRLSLKEILHSN